MIFLFDSISYKAFMFKVHNKAETHNNYQYVIFVVVNI